jgi:uncharacterized protein
MTTAMQVPIPYRIMALIQERNAIFTYPLEQLADRIRETGFRCNRCGTCCTRAVNSHIFLLERDVNNLREIHPAALEPAPDPEFCDQDGTLYVSGYALRMNSDGPGTCWFLRENRCRIYGQRFSVCRIYPYMLRQTCQEGGMVTWQWFSKMNEHGCYQCTISDEECRALAREVKEYENAFLTHQISFLETMYEYFSANALRHDQEMYGHQMQQILEGKPVTIMVYHAGKLEEYRDYRAPFRYPGSNDETSRTYRDANSFTGRA